MMEGIVLSRIDLYLASLFIIIMPNRLSDPHDEMLFFLSVPTVLPFVSPRRTLHRLAEKQEVA